MVHPWKHYYETNKKWFEKKYDRENRYLLSHFPREYGRFWRPRSHGVQRHLRGKQRGPNIRWREAQNVLAQNVFERRVCRGESDRP